MPATASRRLTANEAACVDGVSVDVREMKAEVRRGLLSRLARARETITIDDAVLSGTPA